MHTSQPFPEPGWIHEATGNNPQAWLASVEQLTEASKRVYDSAPTPCLPNGMSAMLSINAVAAMLTGYAVECALKGLWLRSGKKLIEGGKFKQPPGGDRHDLERLTLAVAERVVMQVTDEELNVLSRLSAFVVFAGRYPVHLVAEKMAPVASADGGKQVPTYFSGADFEVASRLLNRFTTALNPLFNAFKLLRNRRLRRNQVPASAICR